MSFLFPLLLVGRGLHRLNLLLHKIFRGRLTLYGSAALAAGYTGTYCSLSTSLALTLQLKLEVGEIIVRIYWWSVYFLEAVMIAVYRATYLPTTQEMVGVGVQACDACGA